MILRSYLLPALLLLVAATTTHSQTLGDEHWDDRFGAKPLTAGSFEAILHLGTEIIAAGAFSIVDDVPANNIARFDRATRRWEAIVPDGIDGPVYALAASPDGARIYVGGAFDSVGGKPIRNIAVWDRASDAWSSLDGVDSIEFFYGGVFSLHYDATDLYIGGTFRFRSGDPSWSIARWNSADRSLHRLGVGLQPQRNVSDFASIGTELYVATQGDSAGGLFARGIARWDKVAARWDSLGAGLNGYAYSLAALGDELYVGGYFTTAAGISSRNIARWNVATESWSAVDTGLGSSSHVVDELETFDGRIAVSLRSTFNTAPPLPGLVLVDPATGTYTSPAGSTSEVVTALNANGDELAAAGSFSRAGTLSVGGIAIYDRSEDAWSALTGRTFLGASGAVRAVVADLEMPGAFYAGGSFRDAGFMPVSNIAHWNGSSWDSLGTGVGGSIVAMTMHRDTLYVAGEISRAGALPAGNVASWNRTTRTWQPLGAGLDGRVRALAIDARGVLYAGGEFTSSGDRRLNGIARWDGVEWHPVGEGVDGAVYALASAGEHLYVGGNFAAAGGNDAIIHIARLETLTGEWAPLGDGVDRIITALLADGDDLYAAGPITRAGTSTVEGIARWDGSAWSPVGRGITEEGSIYALVKHRGDIVAGGTFAAQGASPARFLAVLDDGEWRPLASGVDSSVHALASSANDLVVGGDFRKAGGKSSLRIAIWHGGATAVDDGAVIGTSLRLAPNPVSDRGRLDLDLSERSTLSIDAVDALGRAIAIEAPTELAAGAHRLSLDLSGVPSGAWFLRIRVGNRSHLVPTIVR